MNLAPHDPAGPAHVSSGRRFEPQNWLRLLAAVSVLWGLSLLGLAVSGDAYLVPTVVVLGSFAVPVAWVLRVRHRDRPGAVSSQLLVKLFVIGGVLGFVSSAVIETPFADLSPLPRSALIGGVEETVKIAALLIMARALARREPRAGYLLGATIGFGFAAFETAGYSLAALVDGGGQSWGALANTEMVRAAVAPVTHGLWSGIAGAVIFAVAGAGWRRSALAVGGVSLAVIVLHAGWDLAPSLSMGIALHLAGHAGAGFFPAAAPAHVAGVLNVADIAFHHVLLAVCAAAGLVMAHLVRGRSGGRGDTGGTERVLIPWENEQPEPEDDVEPERVAQGGGR